MISSPAGPIILALLSLSRCGTTSGFTFSASSATQCDEIEITWGGGTGPYTLLLAPVFGTQRNISIPDSSYKDGKGNYSIEQLPLPSGQKFMMTMSDSTGFGTGGNTNMLNVGASVSGNNCDTSDPNVDFSYELNTALQQCRPYTFSNYPKAVQPVTIMGLIPNGDAFSFEAGPGADTYDWVANVWNSTDIVWVMSDAEGHTGGVSDIKTVGISADSSCMNDSSPSATATAANAPSTTATSSASASASSHSSTLIGTIAGTVIGALIFLAVIITLGLFCLRRRHDNKPGAYSGTASWDRGGQRRSQRVHSQLDLACGDDLAPYSPGTGYGRFADRDQDPFASRNALSDTHSLTTLSSNPFSSSNEQDLRNVVGATVNPFTASASEQSPTQTMSSAQRKAAAAGVPSYMPSRFLVHTDADDPPLPPPNDEGVVELPPQYTERRAPAPP